MQREAGPYESRRPISENVQYHPGGAALTSQLQTRQCGSQQSALPVEQEYVPFTDPRKDVGRTLFAGRIRHRGLNDVGIPLRRFATTLVGMKGIWHDLLLQT